MAENSDEARTGGIWRRIAETIPIYLGVLVVLAYPVGFGVLWIQLLGSYVADPLSALYAASVVPVPVVIARSLATMIFLMLITQGCALTFTEAMMRRATAASAKRWATEKQGEDITDVERAMVDALTQPPGIVLMTFVAGILLTAGMPLYFGHVLIDSWGDFGVYVGYFLCVVTAGFAAGYIQSRDSDRMPRSMLNRPTPTGDSHWGQLIRPVIIVAVGAFFGALFLAALQPLSLPSVELQSIPQHEAKLLSHYDQTWYVFDQDGTLLAIPDNEASVVRISTQSE